MALRVKRCRLERAWTRFQSHKFGLCVSSMRTHIFWMGEPDFRKRDEPEKEETEKVSFVVVPDAGIEFAVRYQGSQSIALRGPFSCSTLTDVVHARPY